MAQQIGRRAHALAALRLKLCDPKTLPIAARERETVSALGHALGGDEESVCAALTLAASELSRLEEELRQRERETGRITEALCLGGGAMLCILLL